MVLSLHACAGWAVVDASADGFQYAKSKGVTLYQAQLTNAVDLKKQMEYGYSGKQLQYVPQFTEHTK